MAAGSGWRHSGVVVTAPSPLRFRLRPPACVLIAVVTAAVLPPRCAGRSPRLEVVAEFSNWQVTGVAVSSHGRIFVNFPDWSDPHGLSVAELGRDGRLVSFPNAAWNASRGPAQNRFVCVQSVYVDGVDALWVLDAGSPKRRGVVPGGAKLVRIDLERDDVAQVISFPDAIAPRKSYLNDVRVDVAHDYAFIPDSGLGALIAVDLRTGRARRLLADHPSVKPEPGVALTVEGNRLIDPDTGGPPAIASDGIALDEQGGYLYYKALAGHALYRVPVAVLERPDAPPADVAGAVQKLGDVPASDGIEFRGGRVYLTAIEDNAIVRCVVGRPTLDELVRDERLKWPDSLAWAPDGSLYVTASQIHLGPRFHHGENRVREPYRLFKIAVSPGLRR